MIKQAEDPLWFKDAIIYELHIKAFRDGNGDGIGDFEGLLQKLDYLEELGASAVWLLPFYPSPLRDDGYDIADYYNIHSSYGSIDQFKTLLDEAHKRNLKVITELVINHTSDQHPWFQRARKAEKGSVERNYYVWTDDPTEYKDVRIIFQDFEASNWTWDPVAQQYYWHRFFHHQPDLNYDSPEVQEEIFKIIDYWCAMGVDGFRLDAVPYLFEREGTNGENLPETHDYLKKLRAHTDKHFPGTVFLAEANMWPEDSASYFGDGDECHMNYHFPVMPRMFMSLQMEDRYPITDIFDQTPEIPANCQWAIFLRNHDELTLEMVTDEERDYMYKSYAKDPKARINLGIRHRLAPLMENNRRKIELLNCLLFSLSGTPVIYYGDEIGMGDNVYLGDRNGVRTPMQWSSDRNAGFSETNPQRLYLPVILDPQYHYEAVNVEIQRQNTSSLFWFMKRMINMRKKFKAFSRGDMKFVQVENSKVLAFTRSYEDETILVVVNLSRYSQPAELLLSEYRGYQPVEVFSRNRFPIIPESSSYNFTLGSHAYEWYILEKVVAADVTVTDLPVLTINSLDDMLQKSSIETMQQHIFPRFLEKVKWFAHRQGNIQNLAIGNSVRLPIKDLPSWLLLLQVEFHSGLPLAYQLPVVLLNEATAAKLGESYPQALIAKVNAGGESGVLCDGFYTTEMQLAIIKLMASNGQIPLNKSIINFRGDDELKAFLEKDIVTKVVEEEETYSSIAYGNDYILKVYRIIDRTTNPDAEITKYFTDNERFAQVPDLVGVMEWNSGKDVITLGMLQQFAQYYENGKSFMLDRVRDFHELLLAEKAENLAEFEGGGDVMEAIDYDLLSSPEKQILGARLAEAMDLLGKRTAEMHKALAADLGLADFAPESFSLHYQRSLFAGLQAAVREAFSNQDRNLKKLPEDLQADLTELFTRKDQLLQRLKKIYAHKFEATKIRIHGNYSLEKIFFTGKDVAIRDFAGQPSQTYSERRLKRSPLRDVAGILTSVYYTAYEGLFLTNPYKKEEAEKLREFARIWTRYAGGFFLNAYFENTQGASFIPEDKEDLRIMIETYLLEQAIDALAGELNHRPDWVAAPAGKLKSMLS